MNRPNILQNYKDFKKMQPWNNSSMSFAVLSLHLIRLNKKIDYFSYGFLPLKIVFCNSALMNTGFVNTRLHFLKT